MKISIISASHRPNSESKKVAAFLKNNLLNINSELVPFILDLAESALPLWSPEKKNGKDIWGKPWKSRQSCSRIAPAAAPRAFLRHRLQQLLRQTKWFS